MATAWVAQRSKQVARYGADRASWYVEWNDSSGRRRCKSFGPGEGGRLKAEEVCSKIQKEQFEFHIPRITLLPLRLPKPLAMTEVVYFIEAAGLERIKIGTTNNLKRRLRVLQTLSPTKLNLLLVMEGGKSMERSFHSRFAAFRLHGEWFQASKAVLQTIKSLRRLFEKQPDCNPCKLT